MRARLSTHQEKLARLYRIEDTRLELSCSLEAACEQVGCTAKSYYADRQMLRGRGLYVEPADRRKGDPRLDILAPRKAKASSKPAEHKMVKHKPPAITVGIARPALPGESCAECGGAMNYEQIGIEDGDDIYHELCWNGAAWAELKTGTDEARGNAEKDTQKDLQLLGTTSADEAFEKVMARQTSYEPPAALLSVGIPVEDLAPVVEYWRKRTDQLIENPNRTAAAELAGQVILSILDDLESVVRRYQGEDQP